MTIIVGLGVDYSFSQLIDDDKSIPDEDKKTTTVELEKANDDDDTKLKFENGFYDKITDKINTKNARMSQGLAIPDDLAYHDVIILVERYELEDKNKISQDLPEQNPQITKKDYDVSTKNKLKILDKLIHKHGVFEYANAQFLSFVTAKVPVEEVPKLADYDYVRKIGDGQQKTTLSSSNPLDVSQQTATESSSLPGVPAGLDGSGIKVVMLDTETNLEPRVDLKIDSSSNIINHAFCDVTGCIESAASDSDISYDDSNGDNNSSDGVVGVEEAEIITESEEEYGASDFEEITSVAPGISLLSAKVQTTSGVVHAYDWTLANNARIVNQNINAEEENDPHLQFCAEGMMSETIAFVADELADSIFDNDDGVVLVIDDNDNTTSSSAGTPPDQTCSGNSIIVDVISDNNDNDGKVADANIITASHVSGASAILFQDNPYFTADQLRASLFAGANWSADSSFAKITTASDYESENISDSATTENAFVLDSLDIAESVRIADEGNVLAGKIRDDGQTTTPFTLSVVEGQEIKVVLTWRDNPLEGEQSLLQNQVSNLNFVVLDETGNTVISSSNLQNQNAEFAVFVADETADYTVEISAAFADETISYDKDYAIASTHQIQSETADITTNT